MRRTYIIFIILIGFQSCIKEPVQPSELPPISTDDESLFACYLNGEIFVPASRGFYQQSPVAYYWPQWNSCRFTALNMFHFEDKVWIDIVTNQLNGGAGVYPLGTETGDNPIYGWAMDTLKPNYVEFTKFDTIENVASGTFEFTCINPADSLDIMEATEGRFNLHLITQYQ